MAMFCTRRGCQGYFGAALTILMLAGSDAHSAPLYTVTGIAPLSGTTHTLPTAINNKGQVVGVSYNTMSGNSTVAGADYGRDSKYFLTSGGQTTQLTPNQGVPTSINESGQVVSGATINNSGMVAGGSGVFNPDGSINTALGFSSPYYPSVMSSSSMNNSGLVVGSSGFYGAMMYVPPGGTWAEASLVHTGFTFRGLDGGTFYAPGVNAGSAVGINDAGEVLMRVALGVATSMLDREGHITNLSSLPGGASFLGVALSNDGAAVGSQVAVSNSGSTITDHSDNYE